MNNQDFDRLVESVRQDVPDGTEAAERVRRRLHDAAPASALCASFRVDFPAMRAGMLAEGRQMLLEDHLHSCVTCRREYSGVGSHVLVTMPERKSSAMPWRWAGVAAAVAIVAGAAWALPPVLDRALAPSGARGTVASIEGTLVAVSEQGARELQVGAEVGEGQDIRTGKESRAVVRLRDGSLVEMRERSELSLIERWRSKTVQLARGSVIVEAAKQRNGRLEVATADARVTVKGTIFGVSMGLKGSRVSVVEGEVRVDELTGGEALLHRGDQKTTNSAMEATTVVDDVAWSQNAAKYLALLADIKSISEQLSRIPMPGLRFTSPLLDRVPPASVVILSLPNLSATLDEAERIFEDKARQSAAMAEWWNTAGAQGLREAMRNAKAVGMYLGSEVIVALPLNGPPIVLSEVRQDGLVEELRRLGYPLPIAFDGNIVAMGLEQVPVGGFTSTEFGARILERYSPGVGLLFAANAEQFPAPPVVTPTGVPIGFENLRYVIAEQKGSLQAPVQTATIAFNGARKGLASWLAAPGPMGSLEFISPEATFAASFVSRDPRELLDELMKVNGAQSANAAAEFWNHAGVSLLDDVAGCLGGEGTIALDGALLPTPAWKIAIEVENAERLQWAMEQIAAAISRDKPEHPISITKETIESRTYYTLTSTGPMIPFHYTFVDGYWLLGPSRAVLMKAIQDRAAALTLPRSAAFRAQLPVDGHAFFSGLLYYNMGLMAGPVADQLRASGMLNVETQSKLDALTSNRAPGLVYVYGEPDRIQVGSRSNLLQVGLQTLVAMAPVTGVPAPVLKGPQ